MESQKPVLDRGLCLLIWGPFVPSKVSIFRWRVLLGRLPTMEALIRRRLQVSEDQRACIFCQSQHEVTSLLFLHCEFVWKLWNDVFRWLGLAFVMPFKIDELVRQVCCGGGKWRKEALWYDQLVECIQKRSYMWLKSKIQGNLFDFKDWQQEPWKCITAIKRDQYIRRVAISYFRM